MIYKLLHHKSHVLGFNTNNITSRIDDMDDNINIHLSSQM